MNEMPTFICPNCGSGMNMIEDYFLCSKCNTRSDDVPGVGTHREREQALEVEFKEFVAKVLEKLPQMDRNTIYDVQVLKKIASLQRTITFLSIQLGHTKKEFAQALAANKEFEDKLKLMH